MQRSFFVENGCLILLFLESTDMRKVSTIEEITIDCKGREDGYDGKEYYVRSLYRYGPAQSITSREVGDGFEFAKAEWAINEAKLVCKFCIGGVGDNSVHGVKLDYVCFD